MKLRFLNGRRSGRTVEVRPDGLMIGRTDDNDLQIDEEGISRRHCRVFVEDGVWFAEDLGSTNGIRVNGSKVTGRYRLKQGDRIGLFNQTLLFTDGSDMVEIGALPGGDEPGATAAVSFAGVADAPPPPLAGAGAAPSAVLAGGAVVAGAGEGAVGGKLPWGRVVLLFVVLAGLAWFIKITLLPKAAAPDGAGEAGGLVVEGADGFGRGVRVGVEDDELPVRVIRGREPLVIEDAEPAPVIQITRVAEPVPVVGEPVPGGVPAVAGEGGLATILVETIPPGAMVEIDGVEKGTTPLLIRDLPVGRHEIKMTRSGYEELVRQIMNPGVLPEQPYVMRLRPGTVRMTSIPDGVAVLHGTQVLGTTPLVLADFPIGTHEFGFIKYGYEPVRRQVAIGAVSGEEVMVRLESTLGGIEFITAPAGCRIYVDNVLKGTTVRGDQQRNRSQAFRVDGLREGPHAVRVEHPNGGEKTDTLTVRRGRVGTVFVELWVVDTKLALNDGSERYGMLFSVNEAGDVILNELQPGQKEPRPQQYLREQIVERVEVLPEEARRVMEQLGRGRRPLDGEPGAAVLPGPLQFGAEDGGAWNEAAPAGEALRYTDAGLQAVMRANSATAVAKLLGNRDLVLTGTPTQIKTNMVRAEISFGRGILAEMDRRLFDQVAEVIRNAEQRQLTITVRGKAVAQAQMVTLRQCELLLDAGGND